MNPQFNSEELAQTLAASNIRYEHWPSLGGRRRGLGASSPNKGWEHPAFRAYADYMMEEAFWGALDALLERAAATPTVIMCSETLWWRCHRRMIADAAMARGVQVVHILRPGNIKAHVLSAPAHIRGDRVSYAPTAKGRAAMAKRRFKRGDHVSWNSEAGRVRGTITRVISSQIKFKGYIVRASKDEPQYEIKSDKTDHIAMHKGASLRKLSK